MTNIHFKSRKHIHFTGIKGVGNTALALCARDLGIKVTGSDIEELFVTDETLAKAKIEWKVGFNKNNIGKTVDILVTTGAHGGFDNPEVQAAKGMGIPITSYAEAMSELANEKEVITVCGVGGKTTTCSMLSVLFSEAGLHPSFVVGVGNIFPLGVPGRYEEHGQHFICEGDDYAIAPGTNNNAKFSLLKSKVVIVTNIEHDHPDIYPSLDSAMKTFREYFETIPQDGLLLACVDNKNVRKVIEELGVPINTYGFSKDADWVVGNVKFLKEKSTFTLKNTNELVSLDISVPGRYNILNAVASYVAGDFLGINKEKLKKGLSVYLGSRRRFEKIGIVDGVVIYDDYAHHPEEIKALLKAIREWFPKKRVVVIFQPHTYSRTKVLFKEFSRAFSDADIVGFMDIYSSAREEIDKTVSSKILAQETSKYNKNAFFAGNHGRTLSWMKENIKKGDILLTVGAGDIFHLHKGLLSK
jgi:UDP-N-acetylmuramate--alanine ligase